MNTLEKTEKRPATESTQRVEYVTPLVNILETPEGYVLEAEMPGVQKDGLQVTIENGELLIFGRRQPLEVKGRPLFRESRSLDYRRVFELDPAIDHEHISAKIEQGVLRLHLPKSESVKPRKIQVS
jgi:HSP20 family protein